MATGKKNAFYAQSGGVTAVINASACGVIETARKHKDKIGKVFAGWNGIVGTALINCNTTNFNIIFFAMSCRIMGRGIES